MPTAKILRSLLLTSLVLCLASPVLADDLVRTIEDSFETRGVRELYFDMPVGQLKIEASSGDRVELVVKLECGDGWGSSSCPDRAERIVVGRDNDDDRLSVAIEGYSKWRNRGLQVYVALQVPERLSLMVDMGIGELHVTGMRNDVTVDMGIGEANVRMAGDDVGSVALDTGIGEASLRTPEGKKRGSSGLFTSEVTWSEAKGEAKLRVDLGIGEIDVRLQ
jgi:hypothetical protein